MTAYSLSALVSAGLEEGYLLASQDVLRGVRSTRATAPAEADDLAVAVEEIPTTRAVHALARATAERGEWWRELEILLVAYSGMRWGEHVALRAGQLDLARRRVRIDRQVIEARRGWWRRCPRGDGGGSRCSRPRPQVG